MRLSGNKRKHKSPSTQYALVTLVRMEYNWSWIAISHQPEKFEPTNFPLLRPMPRKQTWTEKFGHVAKVTCIKPHNWLTSTQQSAIAHASQATRRRNIFARVSCVETSLWFCLSAGHPQFWLSSCSIGRGMLCPILRHPCMLSQEILCPYQNPVIQATRMLIAPYNSMHHRAMVVFDFRVTHQNGANLLGGSSHLVSGL